VTRRILADNNFQMSESVEILGPDHSAAPVYQHELSLMLPNRHGLAFPQAQIDGARQAPLDRRVGDPAKVDKPRADRIGIER
jgi:hypothetical protein